MTINYKMEGHRPWERTSYHYLLTMIRMQIWLIAYRYCNLYIIDATVVRDQICDADCIIWLGHIKVDYIFIPHSGLGARRQSLPAISGADEHIYYHPVIPKDTFIYHLYTTRVRHLYRISFMIILHTKQKCTKSSDKSSLRRLVPQECSTNGESKVRFSG
eukprot:582449_1